MIFSKYSAFRGYSYTFITSIIYFLMRYCRIGWKIKFNKEKVSAEYDWLNTFLKRPREVSVRKSGVSLP